MHKYPPLTAGIELAAGSVQIGLCHQSLKFEYFDYQYPARCPVGLPGLSLVFRLFQSVRLTLAVEPPLPTDLNYRLMNPFS